MWHRRPRPAIEACTRLCSSLRCYRSRYELRDGNRQESHFRRAAACRGTLGRGDIDVHVKLAAMMSLVESSLCFNECIRSKPKSVALMQAIHRRVLRKLFRLRGKEHVQDWLLHTVAGTLLVDDAIRRRQLCYLARLLLKRPDCAFALVAAGSGVEGSWANWWCHC
jgi:hypothetical protein